MKQFFKFMFASMLGSLLMFVIGFIIFMIIIAGLVSSIKTEDVVAVNENSVLHFKLDKELVERTSSNPFENIDFTSFESKKSYGLNDILKCLKDAQDDSKIKGVLLDISPLMHSGIATLEEFRNAILDFKKSKKFVIAYGDVFTLGGYYLASAADKVYMNPQGGIDFKGIKAEIMFFKGALQKLEIQPEIIRHGKFKSAVEPFMLDKMSPENREQTRTFLMSIWNNIIKQIAEARKVSVSDLNLIADSMKLRLPEDAIRYKMVDKLMYRDELLAELRTLIGLEKDAKINSVTVENYVKAPKDSKKDDGFSSDKIAVILATGEIKDGIAKEGEIGGESLSKEIRKARLDDKIKAVVLRVNSPGGSALASEIIWREIKLTKEVKPVVVSMGDVAASGGYYISCAANKIFAQPNTITGSIGVFGLMFNAQKLMNNKLGITTDVVKTNEHADLGSIFRPMTKEERDYIQSGVEEIYDVFTKRVAEGRKIPQATVDSVGQGRVWSGVDALKLKLIDEFGGTQDAIAEAAKLAKIEKYRVVYYPLKKEGFEALMEMFNEKDKSNDVVSRYIGENVKYLRYLKTISEMKGIQARLPYFIDIN